MKISVRGVIQAFAGVLVCGVYGGGSMSPVPARTSSSTTTEAVPMTVTFSAHAGYSCTTISGIDFCPGEEFDKLAAIPAKSGGITITRITFLYTVGDPMLNAENFPPGPRSQVAQACTIPPSISIGAPGNAVYNLNLKSGGGANYPGDENPAFNDSGPIAVHLNTAAEVYYGYGNPLDTINPRNDGCWYGAHVGAVQGKLTIQYTSP